MAKKKTKSLSVPLIDADDYDTVQKSGITLTVFIRSALKDKANEIRVKNKKRERELKRLEE